MSIRFGWSRSQSNPLATDEEDVEEVSSATSESLAAPASPTSGSLDALRNAADTGAQPLPDPAAVWALHARVDDLEKKATKRRAKSNVRGEYHAALEEQAAALHALGFSTFDEFAAVHGAQPGPIAALAPYGAPATSEASVAVD